MELSKLPTELLLMISQCLWEQRALNALAQTSKQFRDIVNPELYKHNVFHGRSSGFRGRYRWAGQENITTIRRLLEYMPERRKLGQGATGYLLDAAGHCLVYAAQRGDFEMMELLMNVEGIDLNYRTELRDFALTSAIRSGHESIALWLLAQPSVKRGVREKDGKTPLVVAAGTGNERVVRELLASTDPAPTLQRADSQAGADASDDMAAVVSLTITDWYGYTPLRCALGAGHVTIVRMLLDHLGVAEALLDIPDLVTMAARCGKAQMIKMLGARGDIDLDRRRGFLDRTALMEATLDARVKVVEILASHPKVDVNSRDSQGRTPLFMATESGRVTIVKILLKHGADVSIVDAWKKTPLSWAVHHGREDLFGLLRIKR